MNIATIKQQISLSEFLGKLGYSPIKKSGGESFYLSPIRDSDTVPSFTVNDRKGKWFDHGEGIGGNIIDLAMLIYKENSVKSVLLHINLLFSDGFVGQNSLVNLPENLKTNKSYEITSIGELGQNRFLSNYLISRGISCLPSPLLKEVYYNLKQPEGHLKSYYAIGWQNDKGGWEIRNKYIKACLGKKAFSLIPGSGSEIAVFEGIFDFLSAKQTEPDDFNGDVLILNSLTMVNKAIEHIDKSTGKHIRLFMDNDPPGIKATQKFLASFSEAKDCSGIYKDFKDYNEWHLSKRGKEV